MADSELILATVEAFWTSNPGEYLGRTRMQKLCYFARELGVPYAFTYRMYFYGPYSDELEGELRQLQLDDLLEDASPSPEKYSNYRLTDKGKSHLDARRNAVTESDDRLGLVARCLGALNNKALELLATIKFVHDRRKDEDDGQGIKDKVLAEVLSIKGDKFSTEDAEAAFGSMQSAGLLAS